jgi:ABC-type bacteriocin/lantibiotic exporter with double-glycine peptidase domain
MIDFAIALGAMIVLVIVSPGLAIVGLIALLVLVVCGLSLLFDVRRRRRGGPPRARRAPVRRPPGRPPGRRPARRL